MPTDSEILTDAASYYASEYAATLRKYAAIARQIEGGKVRIVDADTLESCVEDACGYLLSDRGWEDYGRYRDDHWKSYRALLTAPQFQEKG